MTTTAALVAPVTTEDVGSSRSGRKIKPKKFFGEDEPASATKAKPAAPVNGAGTATGGGRGRRKTLAAELDKADKVEEVTPAAPQAEVKECPSREEILAVVGVADTVGQTEKLQEPEKMEVAEEPSDKAKAVEEEQEVKKDDEPTPMEEDLPQELEPESVPEPITTPIVG
ncbi:hypothetical protein RP20_CCG022308 [Aedes albopictus]|nr:hypothetical protein RP20_CCG022308 [Aedes albopictus]